MWKIGRGRAVGITVGLALTLGLIAAFAPRVAKGPSLFVLAVGVDDYHDEHRLNYPVRDARAVAQAFAERAAGVFERVDVRLLTNREADRAGIVRGLAWLGRVAAPDARTLTPLAC